MNKFEVGKKYDLFVGGYLSGTVECVERNEKYGGCARFKGGAEGQLEKPLRIKTDSHGNEIVRINPSNDNLGLSITSESKIDRSQSFTTGGVEFICR